MPNDRQTSRDIPTQPLRSPCLAGVASTLLLCLSLLPFAPARIFSATSKYTEAVVVLMDVNFSLTVTAQNYNDTLQSKTLTERDVMEVDLHESASGNLNLIKLVFEADNSRVAGDLGYHFLRYDLQNIVTLTRNFNLFPAVMFPDMGPTLRPVFFHEPGHTPLNLGDASKSYLCEFTESVSLTEVSTHKDNYTYSATLETSHFHAQAFHVRRARFSSDPPTVCDPPSGSNHVAVIAGVLVGSIAVLGFIVLVVFLLVKYSRREYESLGQERHLQEPVNLAMS